MTITVYQTGLKRDPTSFVEGQILDDNSSVVWTGSLLFRGHIVWHTRKNILDELGKRKDDGQIG
ncbi:hypothetical protein, partial [Caldicellulosiruptor naganoensis]|uniref:hypothetical protein n=1 Tax=Caldicellulosiruptor naganoensis TaxID=29324 RepID=UPI0005EB3C3D